MHEQARLRIAKHLPPISVMPLCRGRGKHNHSKHRADRLSYELFESINDGCLTCVRRILETVPSVSPDVASDTYRWNIRDYAHYAVSKNTNGAEDVLDYLQVYWSHIVSKHTVLK